MVPLVATRLTKYLTLPVYAVGGDISSFRSRGWSWSTGAELSRREYRGISAGPGLSPDVLLKGYALKQLAQVDRELWRIPDKRFESSVRLSSETARLWSTPAHAFERLQVSVRECCSFAIVHHRASQIITALHLQIR